MKIAIKALIILPILFFLGCGGENETTDTELTKVIFGVSPFQDTMLPMLGKEKGWYKEVGLDVEFRVLGWTEVQEALSSGAANRIDLGINNISSVVATHNRNSDLVYYYGFNTFDNGFALMIRPDGPILPLQHFLAQGLERSDAILKTAQQLKGKTVITTSNTDMEQGVAAVAKRGGIRFKEDIEIINLNPDEGLAAFLTGTGDAFIGGIPQRTRAGQEGMIEMITGIDLGPPPINGIVTTRSYASENEDALLKILSVWFKIVNYIDNNKDEGGKIMVDLLNLNSAANYTVDNFKLFWNNYEHYPPDLQAIEKDILSPTGGNYWKARWDDCNDYFYNIVGVIPQPVNSEDAFWMGRVHPKLKELMKK